MKTASHSHYSSGECARTCGFKGPSVAREMQELNRTKSAIKAAVILWEERQGIRHNPRGFGFVHFGKARA